MCVVLIQDDPVVQTKYYNTYKGLIVNFNFGDH